MKKIFALMVYNILVLLLIWLCTESIIAQETEGKKSDTNFRIGNPNDVPGAKQIIYRWGKSEKSGTSEIIRNKPPLSKKEIDSLSKEIYERKKLKEDYPNNCDTIVIDQNKKEYNYDTIIQKELGPNTNSTTIINFDGMDVLHTVPDCNGDVGAYYVQVTNIGFSVYIKESGTLIYGPYSFYEIFDDPGIEILGDPIVLYDQFAGRWFMGMIAEHADIEDKYYLLTAVSTTNDPSGSWYTYYWSSTDNDDVFLDYPKFGVWQDGYYCAIHGDPLFVDHFYVFNRAQMLNGNSSAGWQSTTISWSSGYEKIHIAPPLDNDGQIAPFGTPGIFLRINDDAWGGGWDELTIYEYEVDWSNPYFTNFSLKQTLPVQPFGTTAGFGVYIIEQPGIDVKLDAIEDVIMNKPQYRNFGTYESIVFCHTVDASIDQTGIRWYELRRNNNETYWNIRQQGTYAPDYHNRFLGSIALNSDGQIGLGYSVSSSTMYPSIAFSGQSTSEYALASGFLDVQEEIFHLGDDSQDWSNRWGDYASISVDPFYTDYFWFTSEYVKNRNQNTNGTKIAAFQIEHDCICPNEVCEPSCGETAENCDDCRDPGGGGGPPGGGGDPTWFSCDGDINSCINTVEDFKINCADDELVIVCSEEEYGYTKYPIYVTPKNDGCRFELGTIEVEEDNMFNCYAWNDYCHEEGILWWRKCICEYWRYFVEITECKNNFEPTTNILFSEWRTVFRDTELPPPSLLVNWSILIDPGKIYSLKLASDINGTEDTKYFYTEIEDLQLLNEEIDGTYFAKSEILIEDGIVSSNSEVNMKAGNSIKIFDETIISEGSYFSAKIDSEIDCNSGPQTNAMQAGLSKEEYEASLKELSFNNDNTPQEINDDVVFIYPNPTNNKVYIKLNDDYCNPKVRTSLIVVNTFGHVIHFVDKICNTELSIDLSAQPKGVYSVLIRNEKNSYKERIILQ